MVLAVDCQVVLVYGEASATSLGAGNKGYTPDPPQQNPTGWPTERERLWVVAGMLRCWVVVCDRGKRLPRWSGKVDQVMHC